ncbi:MBL fold metallo-hydrolase [Salicibibacter cibarius]|uniref:MBL fold metallo-hydrolase n=1 Tax=Salicibibacter cibarius TaxID=2743000 RepID=A0A7T6Z4C6_9BACI|nr:alkyl sulfatase dimerization domain-containing protein [Salicibibacter cibarius]QQK76583.1 MBL fold metallo-hydrolase [Salicibibacter cibarius]
MTNKIQNQIKEENSPYMGGEVKTATLANGAIVNEGLAFPKREPKIDEIRDGITMLKRFSLDNTVIIEGKEGVIVWDTGGHMEAGKRKYQALREITNKPVKAIIYSHNHYTMGAKAFVPEGEEGKEIQVLSHPDVHKNRTNSAIELDPAATRNGAMHFGSYLPSTGPDAHFGSGAEGGSKAGYIEPTYGVQDGEKMNIDGVEMQFFYTPSDTYDSLTLWLPNYDTVITNSIWNVFPNMYTLRGQPYRDPKGWIKGIDIIRELNPQYLIPEHGNARRTKEESYQLATNYRDGMAFIYAHAVRGINKGLKPDEIADSLEFPDHLANHPWLKESYGELKHHVKGIYSGLIGWFTLDAADINPVSIPFRSERIVNGFGGANKIIDLSNKALDDKEYAWAAELITHVLNIDPDNQKARQIKANALRQMGYATPASSSRGFYLTHALVLEGKVDLNQTPHGLTGLGDGIEKLPVEQLMKLLEYKIDPVSAKNIDKVMVITLSDLKQDFGLHVRKGIAEVSNHKPKKFDMTIELPSEIWKEIALGKTKIEDVVSQDQIRSSDIKETIQFFNLFEM